MVDYACTSHSDFNFIKSFEVLTVSDVISSYNLQSMITDTCRPPDHSVLIVEICCSQGQLMYDNEQVPGSNGVNRTVDGNRVSSNDKLNTKRYKCDDIPSDFMSSQEWNNDVNDFVDNLILAQNNQNWVDGVYSKFCALVY